ncbi:hypothetical protein Q8I65_09795 [Paenibacillus ottowii]|uniref:hypothetical protein n=1 Tax=Paenibacillus ottowii TaxID=2315729 RepID=UPI0027309640|nr:hypothetical protein [Paenibacillus ottowii]MDP1510496.1 hypothetical protein [Paenibacillus ottowii]
MSSSFTFIFRWAQEVAHSHRASTTFSKNILAGLVSRHIYSSPFAYLIKSMKTQKCWLVFRFINFVLLRKSRPTVSIIVLQGMAGKWEVVKVLQAIRA